MVKFYPKHLNKPKNALTAKANASTALMQKHAKALAPCHVKAQVHQNPVAQLARQALAASFVQIILKTAVFATQAAALVAVLAVVNR